MGKPLQGQLNEQDLISLDTCLDIVEGWEADVYRPTQYSAERLNKSLREQLHTLKSQLEGFRQLAGDIVYAPTEVMDTQKAHNAHLNQAVEMGISA